MKWLSSPDNYLIFITCSSLLIVIIFAMIFEIKNFKALLVLFVFLWVLSFVFMLIPYSINKKSYLDDLINTESHEKIVKQDFLDYEKINFLESNFKLYDISKKEAESLKIKKNVSKNILDITQNSVECSIELKEYFKRSIFNIQEKDFDKINNLENYYILYKDSKEYEDAFIVNLDDVSKGVLINLDDVYFKVDSYEVDNQDGGLVRLRLYLKSEKTDNILTIKAENDKIIDFAKIYKIKKIDN